MATSIQRRPDALRPFGYEIDESVYAMFRALVLTGIILVAAFYAITKIVTFATGGDLPPVKLDWVVAYMALMVIICFALEAALSDKPFALLTLAGAKTGRALFAIAHIRPEQAATDVELDTLRDEVAAACASVLEGMPL